MHVSALLLTEMAESVLRCFNADHFSYWFVLKVGVNIFDLTLILYKLTCFIFSAAICFCYLPADFMRA